MYLGGYGGFSSACVGSFLKEDVDTIHTTFDLYSMLLKTEVIQ